MRRLWRRFSVQGAETFYCQGIVLLTKRWWRSFSSRYGEKNRLEVTEAKANLTIGNDDWPFAVPLAKKDGLWYFDTKAGKEEILARRIGRMNWAPSRSAWPMRMPSANISSGQGRRPAPGICQRFRSDPGKKNGLYWR